MRDSVSSSSSELLLYGQQTRIAGPPLKFGSGNRYCKTVDIDENRRGAWITIPDVPFSKEATDMPLFLWSRRGDFLSVFASVNDHRLLARASPRAILAAQRRG